MSETTEKDVRVLNIFQKIAAITGEIGIVEKGGKNTEQKYDFIEYAAVAGKLRTLFAKYGVVIVPRMAKTADQQRAEIVSSYGKKGLAISVDFTFDVVNADKPDDHFEVTWTGEAADYGDKATNKAATSAIKYYQMRQFNISEKGDDPDADGPDRGTASQTTAPPAPPKKMTIQDAIAKAFAELQRKGFQDAGDRKTVLLKIAGVTEASGLTGQLMNHVIGVLETTSGRELQGYLDADVVELPQGEPEAATESPTSDEPPPAEPTRSTAPPATKIQITQIKMALVGQGVDADEDYELTLREVLGVPNPLGMTKDEAAWVIDELKRRSTAGGDQGQAA